MKDIHNSLKPPDFSVVLGGPLFQLLMRLRLTTPALELLKKRIIAITLFAWLPLLILSLIEGKAWGGVRVPFLYDFDAQARFLVALPLLIAAELLVHKRLRLIVAQFIERKIISEKELPRFRELITSIMKVRNSVLIELFLLLFVFVGGYYLWNAVNLVKEIASGTGSWYALIDSTGTHLSLAGYWYFFVSKPLFQFILYRWYFRMLLWAYFLWQSSRFELQLIATHPDHAGGLGFLAASPSAFVPLIMAHSVLVTGLIADSIFFTGAKLTDFPIPILAVLLFLSLIVLGPLFVFSPHLMRAKRVGLLEYGILSSEYVRQFDRKWVRGGASDKEPLIGNSDIQSLADLGNSFQIIRDLQPVPINKSTVIQLLAFMLIPLLPLVFTMIPLNELVKKFILAIF